MARKTRKEKKQKAQKAREGRRQRQFDRASLKAQELQQSQHEQPEEESILVRTKDGTAAYPAGTHVYSCLGEDQYLEKRVDYLRAGENLLWRASRYALEKSDLFRPNLLKASAELGLIDKESLEDALRGSNEPASDLGAVARYIHEEYSALRDVGLPEIEENTILEWLEGTTAAPGDYEVFLGLGMALEDGTFLRWYAEATRNLYDADLVYTEARSVKVLEVKRLEEEEGGAASNESPRQNLSGGAYTGEPRENMNVKKFRDVLEDFGVLKETYAGLVQEWVSGTQEGRYKDGDPSVKDFLKLFRNHPLHNSVLNQYVAVHGIDNPDPLFLFRFALIESQRDLEPDELRDRANQYADLIYQRTESGDIDQALGLDEFTTKRLGNLVYALLKAVPTVLSDYLTHRNEVLGIKNQLMQEASRRTKHQKTNLKRKERDNLKEMRSIENTIEGNYGTGIDDLLAKYSMLKSNVDSILIGGYITHKKTTDGSHAPPSFDRIESHVDSIYGSGSEAFRPLLPYVKASPLTTRRMALDSLKSYGLEQTFRFIDDRNFVLDKEPFDEVVRA